MNNIFIWNDICECCEKKTMVDDNNMCQQCVVVGMDCDYYGDGQEWEGDNVHDEMDVVTEVHATVLMRLAAFIEMKRGDDSLWGDVLLNRVLIEGGLVRIDHDAFTSGAAVDMTPAGDKMYDEAMKYVMNKEEVVMEDEPNKLFEQLRDNNYDEALAIARMYEYRERCADVPYNDPVKGKGQLTVSSMGIIDRTRQEVK